MNQYNEEIHDPKGLGQPPPYTPRDSPHLMRPTNTPVQTGPILEPVGQPMHGTMGQPIQHGSEITHTGGMYHVHVAPVVVPMVVGNQMCPEPMPMTCQSCKQVIVTRIEARANTKTHMCAFVLCFMCCWPCVFLPYFLDICRNADHHCPNCNAYIGSYVH